MSRNGQSGIDILCDAAAGSDLLPPLAPPTRQSQRNQSAAPPAPPPPPQASPPTKPVKRKLSSSPPPRSGPSHVCHLCNRVYERADHLARHLRAHENARPYQCTRCPKRFNRADLLSRHEATHDRDAGGESGRPPIRRSERASEACTSCAASKAKCDDQKPCGRCRIRNLACSGRPRGAGPYRGGGASTTPESTRASSATAVQHEYLPGASNPPQAPSYDAEASTVGGISGSGSHGGMQPAADVPRQAMIMPMTAMGPQSPMVSGSVGAMAPVVDATQNALQGLDFSSWDLNFDHLPLPPYEPLGPGPFSAHSSSSRTSSRTIMRDPARGHEAFKRSPWVWEPEPEDYVQLEKDGLDMRGDVTKELKPEGLSRSLYRRIRMDSAMRDRVFALVLAQQGDQTKVPSFPSLGLLNYLLLMHFTQEERQFDSWIHIGSFDPSSLPMYVASILSHGATFLQVPAIWHFGMAIHEVVRVSLGKHFESRNLNTRDLTALQTLMLSLDVGIWSGLKRKMELAEAFLCPLVTMIRRAGSFTLAPDSEGTIPTEADSKDILDRKWRDFINRESYKRLVLHLFSHDAQSSMFVCKHPLISSTELRFSLPAARDLWMACSAEQWRDVYLAKLRARPPSGDPPAPVPNIHEILLRQGAMSEPGDLVDRDLCLAALLYSFRSQISGYWESVKLHCPRRHTPPDIAAPPPHWLQLQHRDLYRHLSVLAAHIAASPAPPPLRLASELTTMTLHVSLDDLQKFAGKSGEAEAHEVSECLDRHWATTPAARHAVFHAGQVFRLARLLPPASLRDFPAVAVYYASLTLWIYGLLRADDHAGAPSPLAAGSRPLVLVDGDDSPDTRAFLERGGVPAVRVGDRPAALGADGAVLGEARALMKGNYPAEDGAVLPPLVESLGALMRDLAGDGRA